MNILLLNGHGWNYNISPKKYDSGATGNGYEEAKLTRELADLVESRLKKYATVYRYPKDRNAFEDVQNGTFYNYMPIAFSKVGYALEIHFNAFKKDEKKDGRKKGTECYVTYSEGGITVEQEFMKNLSKYFPLRDNDNIFDGVKRTNFAVIQTLKNYGVSGALLETCFIDDADDIETYQKNKNAIADAIVNGIVAGFGLKAGTSKPSNPSKPSKPSKKPVTDKVVNDVINGKYGNGEARKKNLEKAGYNYNEVQAAVNKELGGGSKPKKSVDTVAKEIINKPNFGGWGTGATREKKLTEYGGASFAKSVQNRVNELLS